MTFLHALAVIAVLQSVFLALIVVLLFVNRTRSRLRADVSARISAEVAGPAQSWLVGEGSITEVAEVLASLPVDRALEQMVMLATSRVGGSQLTDLAGTIADYPWVDEVLKRAYSRNWWRRLDAARLLAAVGGPRHRDLLRRLLADDHPAVKGVATASIPRVADLDSVVLVLESLPRQPLVVRLYQFSMLKETWSFTSEALLARMTATSDPQSLETWVALSEAIGTSELLERVCTLRAHESAAVRINVARALKKYYHPDSARTLIDLLSDPDWRVRAQAARSIGTLNDEMSIEPLRNAMLDAQWWVRFRAALALAQLGEKGRRALRTMRDSTDRYASEMATMISGLSPGSIVEIAES
ncbi:MAG: lyase domain protein repeat-containing protein [Gemmatimonadetes bacterium]|nr:lyase domain protein repeat-containing protein [Gemmatimonadota bacterium]